jgi:hypothetical protein
MDLKKQPSDMQRFKWFRYAIPVLLFPLIFASCFLGSSRLQVKDYQQIEGVQIGMPIELAIKKAERRYSIDETPNIYIEGNHSDYKVYKTKAHTHLLFSFNGGYEKEAREKVYRILVFDPAYLTPEGVHAGMTLLDLRQKSKLESADFNYSDGLFIKASNFDGGYWMDIEGVNIDQITMQAPQIKSLPGNLRIKAIVLF